LDLPDFNLRLARHLKQMGIPVYYFISPQVWAWRKSRVRRIRRDVDHMMVVFPFEREFYRDRGMAVEFVGHPLLDLIDSRKHFRSSSEIQAAPRIAVLPGSRESELRNHGELLSEVIPRIRKRFLQSQIRVPVASTLKRDFVARSLEGAGVEIAAESSWEVLRWADVALVASGTATLETALLGVPQCVFYRLSPSTEWILRNIVRYRGYFGMPNVLLHREAVPELVLQSARADGVFHAVERLILSRELREGITRDYEECRKLLQSGGALERVADRMSSALSH
jgi:lipid-A-disaccharide synthase